MSASCIGERCPTDTQLDAGWVCACGDGWDAHEVDVIVLPDALRPVFSRCWGCEKRTESTVLQVRCETEPPRLP